MDTWVGKEARNLLHMRLGLGFDKRFWEKRGRMMRFYGRKFAGLPPSWLNNEGKMLLRLLRKKKCSGIPPRWLNIERKMAKL
jgi:hypothetical protein